MAKKKNLLEWLPYLTEKELQDIAFAADWPRDLVPLLDRKRAIEALFEASSLFSAAYATTARKLQGLSCAPPANPPD